MRVLLYIALFLGVAGIGVDLGLVLIFWFCASYMPQGGLPWDMVPWYLYVAGSYGLLTTSGYICWWFCFRKKNAHGSVQKEKEKSD